MLKSIQPGTIMTIVGAGEPGYAGDGGPAGAALLNEPKHLALDVEGNLYIADSENHLVRKVDARTGIITTIAGIYVQADPIAAPVSERVEDGDDPLADPVSTDGNAYVQQPDLSGMIRYVSGGTGERAAVFRGWRPGDTGRAQFPLGRGGDR